MAHVQGEIGEGDRSKSQGRRQEARQLYLAKATVCRIGTTTKYQAIALDLSSTGSLLRLMEKGDFEVDDMIDIALQSTDLSFSARASIRQVRDEGLLIGVQMESLTDRGRALLKQLIREIESGEVVPSMR